MIVQKDMTLRFLFSFVLLLKLDYCPNYNQEEVVLLYFYIEENKVSC